MELETVDVRLFKLRETRKVAYLIARCMNDILSREFSREQLEFFHQRFTPSGLRKIATQCTVFVVISGDRILGTASLDGDRVKAVFVNPSFHRRGIGRLLMERVEDEARRREVTACILHANQRAVKFYERINYRKVKEVDNYGLHLIVMRKELTRRKA